MPHFQAIHRLTRDNKTRERALELLEQGADDLAERQYETLTTDRHWFLHLSLDYGIPAGLLGDLMTSREYTEHLARGIVDLAQSQVQEAYRKRGS